MEVRTFWTTFKEVLIIVLGLVVTNAFSGFLESSVSGDHTTKFAFSLSNILTLTTFLIIIFRFGFANIIFADELSRNDPPATGVEKFSHFVSFIILTVSAILLGLMSYYVDWLKYGATMYVWFFILCVVDSMWDISCWAANREKQKFRIIWCINKVVYLSLVITIYMVFKEEFDIFSGPRPDNLFGSKVLFFLILITWASSAVSLITGRKVFFPFLFSADNVAPPPLVPEGGK